MIKRIDHINIVVSDIDSALTFFQQLGFNITDHGNLTGKWIDDTTGLADADAVYYQLTLMDQPTRIELIKYYSPAFEYQFPESMAHHPGFRHLAFEVRDIKGMVDKLKQQNVNFFSEVQQNPVTGKKIIYFKGPENIIMEFAEY